MSCTRIVATFVVMLVLGSARAADLPAKADPGGVVYWLSPSGDDKAAGTQDAPWQSVKQALAAAGDGDTVLMRAGDYTFPRPSPKNRTKDYLTFKPAPGSEGGVRFVNGGYIRPYDNCDYLRFENLSFQCGLYFTKVHHFQVRACTFDSTAAGHDAILINGEDVLIEGNETMGGNIGIAASGKDVIVRWNHIRKTTSDGIRLSGENLLVEGNYFHDNVPSKGAHPDHIQFFGGFPTNVRKVTIRGNYFDTVGQGIFGGAIDSKDGATKGVCEDVLVENNVVINTHLRAWSMTTTNNVICRNNLFGFQPSQLEAGGKPFGGTALLYMRNWGGGEYVFANNICRGCSSTEAEHLTIRGNIYLLEKPKAAEGNLGPMPLERIFVDYMAHDFTIRPDSPTIDAAVAAHAPATDMLGRPRGKKPDIGPVEYSRDDTRPLLEAFLAMLKAKHEAIRATTICKPAQPATTGGEQ